MTDEEVEVVARAIVERRREICADRARIYVEPLELARAAITALDAFRKESA